MAVEPSRVIEEDDLTGADREILDALHDGPLTKGAIVDETGLHRNTVGNRLDALKFGDAIDAVHERTALYRLEDDPREDVNIESESDRRARLQDAHERIDDLEASLTDARGTSQERKERLDDCQEHLANAPNREQLTHALEELEAALERGDEAGIREAITRLKGAL